VLLEGPVEISRKRIHDPRTAISIVLPSDCIAP
jgi:hypothetical protein